MNDPLPVSVVVPTVGRTERLRECLESILACSPPPADVVVVDQSAGDEVAELVDSLADPTLRRLALARPRGVAPATNAGLAAARHERVLVTHDDCTVAPSWVGVGTRELGARPGAIVTGRVLPVEGAEHVPSTTDAPSARDYAFGADFSVLFPNNMALRRSEVLAFGGFDGRIPFAEDNDLCWRWLGAGRPLRYEPELVVWHHDWRSDADLRRLYVDYAVGQGYLYAKHLRAGDLRILRHLLRDLAAGVRGVAAGLAGRRGPEHDWRQGVLRGMPVGLVRGWRAFSPRRGAAP